jgi:hypothetical protein
VIGAAKLYPAYQVKETRMVRLGMEWWSRCGLTCLIATVFTGGTPADAADSLFTPQYHPVLQVSRAPGQIEIDGDLRDPGWHGAQPATNFTEHSPGDEVKPPVETRAFITYDDDHLYLAAVCYADPAQVRATMCEREHIFSDDNIGFFFDTYGDASRAYIININPHGIQYDALWSPNYGEDNNFDLVFASAGAVTDSGYQVELAIPFAALRFPDKPEQEWRFDFYRHHLREVHYTMSWATYDRNEQCWPCNWGYVRGIRDVSPGRGIELLPSFVAHQSGNVTNTVYPDTSFFNGDIFGDLSLGGKYALTSDIVVEASYNPDFSQIEADASQVDVNTTFALFYDERRPFFQEGMDVFHTNFGIIYTRSINDPDVATKASATFGRTSVAVLSAHDEHSPMIIPFEEQSAYVPAGQSYTNMFAVRQSIGLDSYLRAVLTDRRFTDRGAGSLGSLDGRFRLTKSLSLIGQVMVTHTDEPDDEALSEYLPDTTFDHGAHTAAFDGESFSGTGGLAGLHYDSRSLWFYARTYQRTPTYRADNGYQPRNADRWVLGDMQYRLRPSGTILNFLSPGFSAGRIWNFEGLRKEEWIELQLSGDFRFAQSGFWTHYMRGSERLGGREFSKIWMAIGEVWAVPLPAVEGGVNINYGHTIARRQLQMGREIAVNAWTEFRPTARLLVEPSVIYTQSRDLDSDKLFYDGYILRTRVGYQFSRELSFRLVGEYNNFARQWNIDPLVTYRINPFSTFYLGATYDYDHFENCGPFENISQTCLSKRQFFVKLQYLFQT